MKAIILCEKPGRLQSGGSYGFRETMATFKKGGEVRRRKRGCQTTRCALRGKKSSLCVLYTHVTHTVCFMSGPPATEADDE